MWGIAKEILGLCISLWVVEIWNMELFLRECNIRGGDCVKLGDLLKEFGKIVWRRK